MPYEFTPFPEEPEPQTSAARSGGRPPAKAVGIDLLEPSAPSEARATPNRLHPLAILVLLGFAAAPVWWLLSLL